MTAVPLVDLTPWTAGDPAGRRRVATDVDRALCEVGFLMLTGRTRLGATEPAPRIRTAAGPQGAVRLRIGGAGVDPGAWPPGTPSLRPAATAFAARCAALAAELLRVGPHTDEGVLTLTDRQGGLQVRTPDGEWVDAPSVPGALTVNVGDLLARWTGDRWRSAEHRVLPPPVEAPGEELLSLALRQDADPLAAVDRLPTAAAGPTRYAPVTAGEFFRERRGAVLVG